MAQIMGSGMGLNTSEAELRVEATLPETKTNAKSNRPFLIGISFFLKLVEMRNSEFLVSA